MKTIVLANQKGGVGKSAVVSQLAYYVSLILKLRVLVVDLDHQRNTSKALRTGGFATVSAKTAGAIMKSGASEIESADLVLVAGDGELINLEREKAEHNLYLNNLAKFLAAASDQFDLCIIDTNPNPDIRQLSALIVSNYALAPIELNQEAIDGIGDLLGHERVGLRKIQAKMNPKLTFLGIMPNKVEPTPFQRDNFRALAQGYSDKLIKMPDGGFAALKKTTAIAEAQAGGLPVWRLGKTSGREAWKEMRPVFDQIASLMEISA